MALFLLSAVFALSAAATPAVNLSNIVLPVQPTAAEQAAARELEIHLKRLTGKNIVVGREGENLSASAIYLGNTEFARAAGIRCTGFDRDAWLIRRHQDSLIIAGGLPVGTLYGVYEFLEKFCKILWLDQYYTYYPEKGSVELPGKIDETGKPVFAYRGIFTTFNDAPGRIEFLVRNRENLFFEDREALANLHKWGLLPVFGSPGSQDTLYQYIRHWPQSGFEECYSLNKNGIRQRPTGTAGPGQVCFSSPEARKKFTAQLKNFIIADRKNSPVDYPRIYCIIQNDIDDRCECRDCLARAEKYGAYSGVLLEFVNEIASEIALEYPDIMIQTDAYMNTEIPPEHGIQAAGNVRVRFSPLSWEKNRYDMMRPLNAAGNRQAKDCEAWSRLARIHIWDYWVLFGGTAGNNAGVIPAEAIIENHKLYKKCGADYVFSECEYPDRVCFHPLRVWLGYKIKLNPEQEIEPLLNQFFSAYYREAAAPMFQLYTLIMDKQKNAGSLNALDVDARTYLDLDFFIQAERLFAAAETAVAGNPELLCHVTNERVPVDIARIRRIGSHEKLPEIDTVKRRLRQNWTRSIKRWYSGGREQRNFAVMENFFTSSQKMASGAKYPLPGIVSGSPVFDITSSDFNALKSLASYGTELVADDVATGGMAMRIAHPKRNIDPVKFHADNGQRVRFGIYSETSGKHLKEAELPRRNFPKDEKYHLYKIGTVDLEQSTLVWAGEWLLQHRLDSLYAHDGNNRYTVYISLKLQGPAYVPGSTRANAICCDRIIAVAAP